MDRRTLSRKVLQLLTRQDVVVLTRLARESWYPTSKNTKTWDVTSCDLTDMYQSCGNTCWLHLRSKNAEVLPADKKKYSARFRASATVWGLRSSRTLRSVDW
jgi:hypothetical protein